MAGKQQIVALAFPMQGHISPMLRLCTRLVLRGFAVTFVNTNRIHERLIHSKSNAAAAAAETQEIEGIRYVGISDGLDSDEFEGGSNDSLNAALIASGRMEQPFRNFVHDLTKIQQIEIACIISDGYLGWSQEVASEIGIPRAALWTSNAAYSLVNYHLPLLMRNGYACRRREGMAEFDDDHLVTCVPGLRPLHPSQLPSVLHFESEQDPEFRSRIKRVHAMKQATWVLVNSFQEIEASEIGQMQREIGDKYMSVGPLVDLKRVSEGNGGALWREDERCIRWLDLQAADTVLYLSFGSVAKLTSAEMVQLASGVEDSGQPFLWSVRSNLVDEEGLEEFFYGFVERTKDRGLVVEWAPQVEVLAHRSVGGHLTHCGWNSVMESMMMGVPMLCWPCVAEQTMNCKHIVCDWKIGLGFMRKRKSDLKEVVSKAEVEKVIWKLFVGGEGIEVRRNSEKLCAAVRDAVKPGGSSFENLDRFADSLRRTAYS